MNIEQGFAISSINSLKRSEKYKVYNRYDGDIYIIGSSRKKFVKHRVDRYYPDIMIDIISLSERFPSIPYFEWDNDVQNKGIHEAVNFYNKYGHLGIIGFTEVQTSFPIYDTNYYNKDVRMFPVREEHTRDGKNFTFGEPVFAFYDFIWYLSSLSNFWYRCKHLSPNLNLKYVESSKDNIQRLLNTFALDMNLIPTKRTQLYDNDVLLCKGYSYKYPKWVNMAEYYKNDITLKSGISINDNNPEISYSVNSLAEAIILFIQMDLNRKRNKQIKYCKNCNDLVLAENTKVEYCSAKCRSQYTSRKHRAKLASLDGDTNE